MESMSWRQEAAWRVPRKHRAENLNRRVIVKYVPSQREYSPRHNNIEQRDVQLAGEVLANAFRNYPFFEYCLGDADNYDRMAPGMFEGFVRWTMLYGKAWTTSDMNAVMLRQAQGEQRHRILECLAFRFSVFLFCGWTLPLGADLVAQLRSSQRLTKASWGISHTGIVG
jgi:hypothetical protein